ncbi:hypothetical protein [Pseudomonas oryzihabitans]|uniref:hypothetical protein n=1 Tax=Pseudomonas oryzihabitans TaxID=47885 RepID=UPI002895CB7C|nr:hypothetical protein [Pseudomonas oryzihabitans]MDT3722617.1 hypothetical protein [Pseudomonas oryzihabitans]
MLKLPQISVFGTTRTYLERKQKAIDDLLTYAEQVAAAKDFWEGKNRNSFAGVRSALEAICPGARRCHYCEDSVADEVEHVWPKKFYPEKTFVWQNYLFSCGSCNGSHKNDQFAVFDAGENQIDVIRGKNDPISPPPVGSPLFIDPISEDPTEYISLDLQTGLFVPLARRDSRDFKRAEYTINILGLNSRDYLSRARRNAYAGYLDALSVYAKIKAEGCSREELLNKQAEIGEKHHPSVWHEIKSTARLGIAHQNFFQTSPELYEV